MKELTTKNETPARDKFLPYGHQWIDEEDIQAVVKTLRSSRVTRIPGLIMKAIKNFGIGTDIESIDRFRKLDLVDNNLFLNRIFTKNELDYCFSKEKAAPHLAARYTGKEAVMKALSSIGKVNLNYSEIEILNNEKGMPLVRLSNRNFNKLQVYLSLSHCKDKAIAFAIAIEVTRYEES